MCFPQPEVFSPAHLPHAKSLEIQKERKSTLPVGVHCLEWKNQITHEYAEEVAIEGMCFPQPEVFSPAHLPHAKILEIQKERKSTLPVGVHCLAVFRRLGGVFRRVSNARWGREILRPHVV